MLKKTWVYSEFYFHCGMINNVRFELDKCKSHL